MAKLQRKVVASVLKGKEPGAAPYIKVRDDISFKKGQFLRLESAKSQLTSLEEALKNKKLPAEIGEMVKERIAKIPEYVLFEVVVLEEKPQQ